MSTESGRIRFAAATGLQGIYMLLLLTGRRLRAVTAVFILSLWTMMVYLYLLRADTILLSVYTL